MSFILSTDTACDIKKSELKEKNIFYVPLTFTIDDVSYPDEFDSDSDYVDFYDKMTRGAMPTTSQVNIYAHEEYFKQLLAQNEGDLLHVTLSSGLSGTYASALKAAESVMQETGRNIYILDSKGATVAMRIVVDDCYNMREAGMSAKEVFEAEQKNVNNIGQNFMTYDLMHLKRGGRVSGPAAFIGTVLNIKPILTINIDGGLSVVKKIPGVPKALKHIIDEYKKEAIDAPQTVYVGSANSQFAEQLAEMARKAIPQNEVVIGWFGPVIGAHVGSGTVALTYRANKNRIPVNK